MRIKEYHTVIIRKHPYAESLNKKLLQDAQLLLETKPWGQFTNIHGKRTLNVYDHSANVQRLVKWILSEYKYDKSSPVNPTDDPYIKKSVGCWFAKYGKGDYAQPHDHRPHTWSWVYFVNCPKGSAPLIFSTTGKRIKAEEGKLIIFEAHMLHEVPKNKCDNRIICAGNVTSWTEHFSTPINI